MAKFIIVANTLTAQQQDSLTELVKSKNWGFWHWFENTWLLHDAPEDITAKAIAEEVDSVPILYNASIIVMKVSGPITYWGRSPQESWEWMQKNWGTPGL